MHAHAQVLALGPHQQLARGAHQATGLGPHVLRDGDRLPARRAQNLAPVRADHPPEDGERVEAGVVGGADALEQHQRAEQVDELARQHEGPGVEGVQHLLDALPHTPATVLFRGFDHAHDLGGGLADLSARHLRADHPQPVHGADGGVDVLANDGHREVEQRLPGPTRNLEHRAPVEHDQGAVLRDQQVARVGIGVKEPVHHHHAQIHRRQPLHQHARRGPSPPHALAQAVDAGPLHVLHDQHAPGGEPVEDAGCPNGAVAGEGAPEAADVVGLDAEVHLLAHLDRELPDHVRQRPHVVVGEEDVQPEDDPERRVHIQGDPPLHPGPQHLDGDVAAIQPGPVHLTQTGGGDGLPFEALEEIGELPFQLLLDHAHDLVRGVGRHAVPKRSHRGQIGFGKDVGARGEHLRQLDEGGPQRGDRLHEAGGAPVVMAGPPACRASDEDPPPAVAQEPDEEGLQTKEHPRKTSDAPHGGVMASASSP